MSALFRYLSPMWGWVLLWWLLFNGSLFAFVNGIAGGMLDAFMQQLWGELDQWKGLLGWM